MYYAYDNTGKLYGFYYYGSGPDSFYFYKRNVQGDIIGILDNSGTEVVTYTYDAWGKLEDISGTYVQHHWTEQSVPLQRLLLRR